MVEKNNFCEYISEMKGERQKRTVSRRKKRSAEMKEGETGERGKKLKDMLMGKKLEEG